MGRGSSKGGRGGNVAGAAQTAANVSEEDAFVNEMVRALQNPDPAEGPPMSNGDLQAVVEAFAMSHPDVDEDALLDRIRSEASRQAAPTLNPNMEGRVEVPVSIVSKDGTRTSANVSIQNTSKIDNAENVDYISGRGRYREGNIYRNLASDAMNNATDSGRADHLTLPETTAGKWTKTDNVPIVRRIKGATVLEKASGYATKAEGTNVYIQKAGSKWGLNVNGLSAGPGYTYKSLTAAKAGVGKLAEVLHANPRLITGTSGQLKVLNKNLGRISESVWKEIDFDYVGGR